MRAALFAAALLRAASQFPLAPNASASLDLPNVGAAQDDGAAASLAWHAPSARVLVALPANNSVAVLVLLRGALAFVESHNFSAPRALAVAGDGAFVCAGASLHGVVAATWAPLGAGAVKLGPPAYTGGCVALAVDAAGATVFALTAGSNPAVSAFAAASLAAAGTYGVDTTQGSVLALDSFGADPAVYLLASPRSLFTCAAPAPEACTASPPLQPFIASPVSALVPDAGYLVVAAAGDGQAAAPAAALALFFEGEQAANVSDLGVGASACRGLAYDNASTLFLACNAGAGGDAAGGSVVAVEWGTDPATLGDALTLLGAAPVGANASAALYVAAEALLLVAVPARAALGQPARVSGFSRLPPSPSPAVARPSRTASPTPGLGAAPAPAPAPAGGLTPAAIAGVAVGAVALLCVLPLLALLFCRGAGAHGKAGAGEGAGEGAEAVGAGAAAEASNREPGAFTTDNPIRRAEGV
jgi:hypothetical protein